MSSTTQLDIRKLSLDLKNFRTVPQKSEIDAIKAMISISPDRFFAVLESIIEEGYTPTENIIVLNDSGKNIVKEGNRRIACLKLIQDQYKVNEFGIPTSLLTKINALDVKWKKENSNVPCIVFEKSEEDKADRVVSLTHGKGEKANREKWSSVATARHNRDAKGTSEPALDLLEKYLSVGNNLTNQQKERWAGDYPVTVLYEAIRVIHSRLSYKTPAEFVTAYPKISNLSGIEDLLRDVGLEQLQFKTIRDPLKDFAVDYGISPIVIVPTPTDPVPTPTTPVVNPTPGFPTSPTPSSTPTIVPSPSPSPTPTPTPTPATTPVTTPTTPTTPAYAINDPRRVAAILKKFNPKGNRDKIVTLRDEIKCLDIKKNPIAFCFILRSMFEISAKGYCDDNAIPTTKTTKNGIQDKTLLELLKEVTNHLTNNNANKAVVKILHGALTELAKPTGLLSVTSMNNLVHNPSFSISASDICTLFGNVYPLLEYMN
jgi:hypothetical protein